jgi:hypothetical protein
MVGDVIDAEGKVDLCANACGCRRHGLKNGVYGIGLFDESRLLL